MITVVRSMASRRFRVWFIGGAVSNIGTWMQATAMNWVVLTVLTDHDATAMGMTMALQFAPPLLLVSVAGWVADVFDRRRLLMATQLASMLVSILIGSMLLAGALTQPMMYVLALALGIVIAFDGPARQALVSDLVTSEHASNAIALNAASFNGARMVGPAVSGLLIVAVGPGWVFLINAASFLAMLAALIAIGRGQEREPTAPPLARSGFSDGVRYVARRADLVVIIVMVALIGALGMNFAIMASTMALEFDQDAAGFGLLTSFVAVGAFAGALVAAQRARARLHTIIAASAVLGVTGLVSASMPTYWGYAATLVVFGVALETTLTTANGYVQTSTPATLRGRVLAIYMAILIGATPIGAPIVGWVASEFGARAGVTLSAIAAITACAVGSVWLIASHRIRRHPTSWYRLSIDESPSPSQVEVTAAGELTS
ncbi:MFS transporter [Agromyces kandeliae]|uniref:MFS transporter n=1 Tax=Agromyces kandeliae TaxID=2666141 RepID=A0A6L5R5T4_9MICO|nr:MFS transporter [Agromyces kandeliae]MRX45240.1 MFS transporter [Agromyces kandeliae]